MAVLLESPWYNEILQEGEKRGERRGERRGKKKGLLSGIAAILEVKFGEEGLELLPEIEGIDSVETLETILSALKTASAIEQVRGIYQ